MAPELEAALAWCRLRRAKGDQPPWVWQRLVDLQNVLEWFEKTDGGALMTIPLDEAQRPTVLSPLRLVEPSPQKDE